MNAAMVSSLISMIPERIARLPSGSVLVPHEKHGPRVAHLLRFLHWLSPLERLAREDQRVLGLLAPHVRAVALEEEEKDVQFDPDATLPCGDFDLEEPTEQPEDVEEIEAS